MNKAKIKIAMAMFIFGSIGIFVKKIPLPSTQIALTRGLIGSLILTIAVFIMRQKINWKNVRRNLPYLLCSGCIFGFNWIFLFKAYQYTTIANATLSYYFAPIIVMLLSPIVFKERLMIAKLACLLTAMGGMFCITGTIDLTESSHYIGIAYGLTSASLYAGVMIINKFLKDLSSIECTLFQLAITSVVMLPYVFISEGLQYSTLDVSGWVLLLIVGVVHTGLAFMLFLPSIQKLEGQTTAILSYIDPVSAIVLSGTFLDEKMNPLQVIGGILIIGAAFISELLGKKDYANK